MVYSGEWLIYAQSPEGETSNITVDIPDYTNVAFPSAGVAIAAGEVSATL